MEALRREEHYTYTDYCTWDNSRRWELINGVAYAMSPSPSRRHQAVAGEIFGQLREFLKGKHCKVFIAPFDVRLNADGADDTVVQPDILVVCDESKLEGGNGVVGAPDYIAEILSSSSIKYDWVNKKRLYLRSGVREYWIVDPDAKIVTAHVLRDGGYMSYTYDEHDAAVPVEVLSDCVINLADVFEAAQADVVKISPDIS